MGAPVCDDDEFIVLFRTHGPTHTAKELGVTLRGVFARRDRLEKRHKVRIIGPNERAREDNGRRVRAKQRLHADVSDGIVLVGSDAHYWPGEASTAHRAFVHFIKKLKPEILVMNGDVMDFASISRHPRIGWDEVPTVIEEIEVTKERLEEIRKAARKARLIWSLGNHDARFETMLANRVPEYAHLHGISLQDHFPFWEPCWSTWVNDVVIKHRFKGGIHATHNNVLWAGKSVVTGHLHSMKVTPFSDYNGIRYGVDTGTMMEPWDEQTADYTEDNPVNWRSGFIVLTFRDGVLLWPEIVHVLKPGHVEFRGEIIEV